MLTPRAPCRSPKSETLRVGPGNLLVKNSPSDSVAGVLENTFLGFPESSVGKGSSCNTGDPGLIPGSGRSPGEGIGYPLQYVGASLVAQLVKNLPAMWETWVQSLDWKDPLDQGMATIPVFLSGDSPSAEELGRL